MLLHGWAFCPIWSCCSFWAHAMIAPWSTLHGFVSQVERKLRIPQIPKIPKSEIDCCRFDWVQSEKYMFDVCWVPFDGFLCLSLVLRDLKTRKCFEIFEIEKHHGGVACGLEINDEREITALRGWPTESLTLSTRATWKRRVVVEMVDMVERWKENDVFEERAGKATKTDKEIQ